MSDPEHPPPPDAGAYEEAYEAHITGDGADVDGWEYNSISVSATTIWNTAALDGRVDVDEPWADQPDVRQFVRFATGYKPGREDQHPVLLGRLGAVELIDSVLQALEDTFHATRVGRLRAHEAAELLERVGDLDYRLAELRSHALGDLRASAGLEGPHAGEGEER